MYSINDTGLSDEERRLFASTFLLDYMATSQRRFDVLLLDGEKELEPILERLMMRGYVEFDKNHHYALTKKGEEKAQQFRQRYQVLLTYFDVFAHVDLGEGEFALSSYADYHDDRAWLSFLDDERWEDLRVLIVKHLGGNPIELVFAHYVRELRLDTNNSHWALDVLAGSAWKEIEEICREAITADELSYEAEEGVVPGEAVLDDIVEQGFEVLREHHATDAEVHSLLQAWYPRKDLVNHDVPPPLPGWERPIWQTPWTLEA